MSILDQERAFVDRRMARFHLSFLELVTDPKKRGRHRVVLEEPGWRILIWCLLVGMSRPFPRANRPQQPRGVHAALGDRQRLADLLGLSPERLKLYLGLGEAAGLWKVENHPTTQRAYLELSPEHFWIGNHEDRKRAMNEWKLFPGDSNFLLVEGFLLRRVLIAQVSGAGIGSEHPMVMTPGDWRFLFQVAMARVPGGLRWEGRPARFTGSIRTIAPRLGLSHTALREHIRRIQEWECAHGVSSPMAVDLELDAHPTKPGLTAMNLWINPLWFQLPSKIPRPTSDVEPVDGEQVVFRKKSHHAFATREWHRRFENRPERPKPEHRSGVG